MSATIKFFGRYKRGAIRDGGVMAIEGGCSTPVASGWSCDADEVVAVFDTYDHACSMHEIASDSPPIRDRNNAERP